MLPSLEGGSAGVELRCNAVTNVGSGHAGVDMISTDSHGGNDDLVISDIRMPGLDGLSLLRHLREQQPGSESIIITGHGDVPMAVRAMKSGAVDFIEKPFDDDKLHEECGVYGVFGLDDAATYVTLGLHALQHRGQEAGGIVTYTAETGFNSARRFGYVRDNFTSQSVMETLPGPLAIGHVRYSTAGTKGQTAIRDVQPFFGEFSMGGFALAHNGNLTNAEQIRRELIERGSMFHSSLDTECIIHLMARSLQRTVPERMKDALRRVEGAFSIVAMTRTKLIGVRDPMRVRPLVLGRRGEGWILSSETCALDILNATYEREVEPGEMVVTSGQFLLDSEARLREALAKMIKGDLASEQKVQAAAAGARTVRRRSPAKPAAASAPSSSAKERSGRRQGAGGAPVGGAAQRVVAQPSSKPGSSLSIVCVPIWAASSPWVK